MANSFKQIAQSHPADTSFHTLASLGVSEQWNNAKVVVCNTTASPVNVYVCHDNSGGGAEFDEFDESTALVWAASLDANDTLVIDNICAMDAGSCIGVKSGTASALTFTMYGLVHT